MKTGATRMAMRVRQWPGTCEDEWPAGPSSWAQRTPGRWRTNGEAQPNHVLAQESMDRGTSHALGWPRMNRSKSQAVFSSGTRTSKFNPSAERQATSVDARRTDPTRDIPVSAHRHINSVKRTSAAILLDIAASRPSIRPTANTETKATDVAPKAKSVCPRRGSLA